jgi:hypothetical protein
MEKDREKMDGEKGNVRSLTVSEYDQFKWCANGLQPIFKMYKILLHNLNMTKKLFRYDKAIID